MYDYMGQKITLLMVMLLACSFSANDLFGQEEEDRRTKGRRRDRKPPPAVQQPQAPQPPNNPPPQPQNQAGMVTLTGLVKDQDTGEGVIGAAVMLEDRTTGALIKGVYADDDGRFTLPYTPSGNAVRLKIQYTGMKTATIDVSNQTYYEVILETDAVGLEEVVITALNVKQKKADLGYVVQEVKTTDLLRSAEQNIVQALAGKAAGVQVISSSGVPGASSTIIIRGQSSITGNNEALFVVDGVPIDNSTRLGGLYSDLQNARLESVAMSNRSIDLNPDDIESVTILKGPAAAALYGTRAGAGTVVITTKKGSRGMGTSVSLRSAYEMASVNKLPEVNRIYSQGTDGIYLPPDSMVHWSWGSKIADIQGLKSYDNLDAFFQTAHTISNTVSLAHSTDQSAFRLSLGRMSQTGIVPNTDFSRTSVRTSFDTDIGSKLKLLVTANYVNSGGLRAQQGSNLSGIMLALLRSPASYDLTNGSKPSKDDTKAYFNPDYSQRSYSPYIDNPFFSAFRNTFEDKVNRLMSTATLTYTPTSWLEILYRGGLDFFSDRQKDIRDYASLNGPSRIIENQYFYREWYGDLLITAKKNLNHNWKGSLTIGNNLNERSESRLYSQGLNLIMPNTLNPGFYNISSASDIKSFEDKSTIRIISFFAIAKLQYRDILTLQVTGRNETSSTFGPDNKSLFYPSVNTGFVFTELEGYKSSKMASVLTFGKIRAAYSIVGIEPKAYQTRTYFTSPTVSDGYIQPGIQFPFNGLTAFTLGDIRGNRKLRPERVDGFEIGADLRFWENKIGIDVTYYHEKTTNAIFRIPVANSSGFDEFVGNSGQLTNQGIELVINSTIERKTRWGTFKWIPQINFTRNRSRLDKLAPDLPNLFLGGFSGSDIRAAEGQPYGQIYGTDFERNSEGKIVVNENGIPIVALNEKILGNIQPDFLMGFGNEFHFNDLVISFLIDWKQGGDIWNGTRGTMNVYGTSRETEDRGKSMIYPNSVTAEGKPNTTSMVKDQNWYQGEGGGFSGAVSQFIEDGSWVRLREVSIAYSIKKIGFGKHLDRIDLTLTGRNLLLYTPYKGIDPETNLTGAGSNALGMDYYNMPNTRSVMFAINLNFK